VERPCRLGETYAVVGLWLVLYHPKWRVVDAGPNRPSKTIKPNRDKDSTRAPTLAILLNCEAPNKQQGPEVYLRDP
jgi:hypothetical protein